MQTQKADFFERMLNKAEVIVNYYVDHQELLWRPFTNFAMLASFVNLVLLVPELIEIYAWRGQHFIPYPSIMLYRFFASLVIFGLSFAVQNFLKKQKSAGITAAIILLGLSLIFGYFLTFLFGLYAFFNKPFRENVKSWAPRWFVTN